MKTVFKWIGIALGCLVVFVLVAYSVVYFISERSVNMRYDIELATVDFPAPDSAMLAKGAHQVDIRGCKGCHGRNLGGEIMIDDALFGTFFAANLTPGAGSATINYSDDDWIRSIRHAVGPDGRALLVMPSNEFVQLGAGDLAAIILYLKQVEPVDWIPPNEQVLGPIARAIHVFTDDDPLVPAGWIDHDMPFPTAPEPGITPAYGRYLAITCASCHGEDLATPSPGPPDTPPPADLTALDGYGEAAFLGAVRTGVRPAGDTLHTFMPRFQSQTDDELKAIWAYLETIQ